jgi:aminoglycoside 6'-N-acetyltransferase I
MRNVLWSESSIEEHRRELAPILAGKPTGAMPLVILVAVADNGMLAGFVEAGLRSHADGCDTATPVGFVEGWYVSAGHRRRGVGAKLMTAAQDWARGMGCVEMASDTLLDNDVSQRAHQALGFEVVDRCINYRKRL